VNRCIIGDCRETMRELIAQGVRAMTIRVKPLCIDLFCGLGGWSAGFIASGWDCIGFDVKRHQYGEERYPAQLVLQNVLTLHGSQFRNADIIVASPPCEAYSYRAMPWKRAKALPPPDNSLFALCFRIQHEACEAAGRHIPLIVENVRGAQPWVGRSRWNYGSYHLWGDVPALMPITAGARKFNPDRADGRKNDGGSWFARAHNTTSGKGQNPDGRLISEGIKTVGHVSTAHLTNQAESDGIKHHASGAAWFDTGPAALPSGSPKRKYASAMIAKIPMELSTYIAQTFRP
jgi:hypothetical protein